LGDEAFEKLRSRLRDRYAFEVVQEPPFVTGRQWWRETCGELRKVTWPTTEQTRNLTLVVIAVCVVMGTFLGVVDFVLGLLVRLVIRY
jgi:preprotein translocase subunit SecE